jgi:uncharacterized spore protein YtfJ
MALVPGPAGCLYLSLSAFICGLTRTGGISMSDKSEMVSTVPAGSAESCTQVVHHTLENFISTASSETVYHEPIKHGNTLIIPAAEVVSILGFGVGGGSSSEKEIGSGGGGGGGGSVYSRPVAVIISAPEGVRIEPVFDLTKIAIAGMTTGMLMFGMIGRLWSLSKKIQDVQDEFLKIK